MRRLAVTKPAKGNPSAVRRPLPPRSLSPSRPLDENQSNSSVRALFLFCSTRSLNSSSPSFLNRRVDSSSLRPGTSSINGFDRSAQSSRPVSSGKNSSGGRSLATGGGGGSSRANGSCSCASSRTSSASANGSGDGWNPLSTAHSGGLIYRPLLLERKLLEEFLGIIPACSLVRRQLPFCCLE